MAALGRLAGVLSRSVAARGRLFSAEAHSEGGSARTWKVLTFLVAFPSVAVAMLNSYLKELNHHEERPEFIPYEHLRIRSKKFPWGDGNKTLFHNSHMNALPDGYEECEDSAHH
ncbi:cytochrome c oxidase subunit 6A1, mitochondrial [Eleutherodactylus coqui]|uniref:Cytochrome c oxidase subunit n=1 Tax=Eleutherodactylus coqui TaxID=57060 RepID=A0A8J6FGD3_ELECQ|nr:hypothetical protein GDO78_007280 [Eleutherodactylus coqui]